MPKLIRPNDIEARTLSELLRDDEPFCDIPKPHRQCLLRCFQPVSERRMVELPDSLKSRLENCQFLFFPEPQKQSVPEFAAEVLFTLWRNEREWQPLWLKPEILQAVVSNLVNEVGNQWAAILDGWSGKKSFSPILFYIEVLLRHLDITQFADWNRCSSKNFSFSSNKLDCRNPAHWLFAAVEYGREVQVSNMPTGDFRWCEEVHPLFKILKQFESAFKNQVAARDWKSARAQLQSLEQPLNLAQLSTGRHGTEWAVYENSLVPWFDAADQAVQIAPDNREALLLWFKLGTRCYGSSYGAGGGVLPQDVKVRLARAAHEQLGMMRVDFRTPGQSIDWDFYYEALDVARLFGGWWQAVKPLLLAFRDLQEPSVTSDLRHWREPAKDIPPETFPEQLSRLPVWIANMLSNPHLRGDRENDPELVNLRSEFAAYCIKRLKTKDTFDAKPPNSKATNDDFLEPNPIWRACYAQAARELRINPRGKSHHIAYWSSQNDPDPEVREAAKHLYTGIRHQTQLDPGLSPRRPLLAAFWWLRQAHLLALGREIDERGAQRTRTKELRRSEEFNRRFDAEAKANMNKENGPLPEHEIANAP